MNPTHPHCDRILDILAPSERPVAPPLEPQMLRGSNFNFFKRFQRNFTSVAS